MTHSARFEGAAMAVDKAAHDLNNLCTSMLGFAELTLDTLAPESREHAYLQEIAESGRHAMALAGRLRQIASSLRGPDAG